MSINPKLKRELESMWDNAEEAGGSEIPDGTYQLKITAARFHMTEKKPTFKMSYEIVGGSEDLIGEVLKDVNDNLETGDNMGWFKKKLAKLNITGVTFDDIENGTLAEQLVGKVFEGQAKSKGGFLNLYVNRLIGEGDGGESAGKGKKGKEEESEETEETAAASYDEGDQVTWNGKTGEVVEVLEDEGLVRVKKEDGTVVRVALDIVKPAKGKAKEEEEEEEEEIEGKGKKGKEDDEFTLPEPEDIEGMSMKEVKEALAALDFEASDLKSPRGVLHAFCVLAHDEDAKIDLTEVTPLADALDITLKKGAPFKESLKLLSKAVQKRVG
jgi:hypothetical protein